MAQNRSSEIAMLKRDINRLYRAAMVVGEMATENNYLTDDISMLDVGYRASAYIPQTDFSTKMTALNENIAPAIVSLNKNISDKVTEFNQLLVQFEKEQEEWEAEQEEKDS